MAISLGYKNGAALLEAHRADTLKKEAEAKGVEPEFYKEFSDVKAELAETRKSKAAQEHQGKVDKFVSALDEVATSYSLTAIEKQGIIDQLGEDGYTMDDIVAIKAPKKLIRGYLSEKIAKTKVQESIKTKKAKADLAEDKIHSETIKEDDWKKSIHDEMKTYAKENNLLFEE